MARLLSYLVIVLLCATAVAARAEDPARLALVTGNWSYETAPLKNPKNDVRAMAKVLRAQGFEVMSVENGTQHDMRKAIMRFGWALRETRGIGLFYYAGHGMRVKGRNYLVPVDAIVNFEEEVPIEGVDVATVLSRMETAENALNLVILDDCRNNPFARSFRSAVKGLASIDAPAGTLLAYATAPGSVAADGSGDNGLYTEELVAAMQVPGQPIEAVFKQVRSAVKERSDGQQIPWESTSLEGDFYFVPEKKSERATRTASAGTEKEDTGAERGVFAKFKQPEGRRRLGHYSTADGLVGFVFDRTGDTPAVKFDDGGEILTLEAKTTSQRTTFMRDDGAHLISVAVDGAMTLWLPRRGGVPVERDGGADALRLPDVQRAAVEARVDAVTATLAQVLGKPVPIEVDWPGFSDSRQDLGTLAAALDSLAAAFTRWRQDATAIEVISGEIQTIKLAARDKVAIERDQGVVTIALAPARGLAGRPTSHRLGQVLAQRSLVRVRAQNRSEELLRERLARTRAACAAEIDISVDWSTWTDDDYSVRGWCESTLEALGGLCRHPIGAEAVRDGVRSITCRVGPERGLDLKDGMLSLTYDGKGRNNRAFTHRFLMNNL